MIIYSIIIYLAGGDAENKNRLGRPFLSSVQSQVGTSRQSDSESVPEMQVPLLG